MKAALKQREHWAGVNGAEWDTHTQPLERDGRAKQAKED